MHIIDHPETLNPNPLETSPSFIIHTSAILPGYYLYIYKSILSVL